MKIVFLFFNNQRKPVQFSKCWCRRQNWKC